VAILSTKLKTLTAMRTGILGIIIIALGILMMAYTGFNIVTQEEVVDLGPLEINREKNNIVQWPPIVGLVLVVAGLVLMFMDKRGTKSSA
jgi:hypothetical protein